MSQFHIVLKDYANWKMENVEFIERLKADGTILYQRIEPVYLVLNDFYKRAVEEGGLDEDLETIFQVGFDYLHAQIELVRVYRDKLFDADHERLLRFAPLVGYLLSLIDFRADLEEQEEEIDFAEIEEVETMIETMIAEGDRHFDYAGKRLKEAIENTEKDLDSDYVGIVDIFVEIAENLGIELDEGDTYVVGTDL